MQLFDKFEKILYVSAVIITFCVIFVNIYIQYIDKHLCTIAAAEKLKVNEAVRTGSNSQIYIIRIYTLICIYVYENRPKDDTA